MYNLVIQARPSVQNKYYHVNGDAFLNCWLNVDSKEKAKIALNKYLEANKLELIETLESNLVNRLDLVDDEKIQLFRDAEVNKEVYQLYQSPKYSTLIGTYKVLRTDDEMDVNLEIWIDVNYLSEKIDMFKFNFWQDRKIPKILNKKVNKLIKPEGFKLNNMISISAVERIEGNDRRMKYQNDVDEFGYSLIFKKPK